MVVIKKMLALPVGHNQLALVIRQLDIDEQDKQGEYRSTLGMPNTDFVSCSVT